jgi:predicted aspartyl protease
MDGGIAMIGRAEWCGLAAVLALASGAAQGAEPAACALVQAAQADNLLSVPFRTVDGRIYVEARVDAKGPFTFAVDTGASGMGRADAALVTRLALPLHGSGETSDGMAKAKVDTVRLASIDLGGFVRRDLEVITRDYASRMAPEAKFDGIIGREFFADGLLVIDYPSHRLTFTRAAGLARGMGGALGYERAFRVPVSIGDAAAEGNLDTGANVAFVLPKLLFDRSGGGPVAAAGAGQLTNSAVETGRATVHGPFRIGAAEWSDVEVRVSERYPELLVGAHALERVALLIDQRTQTVALCPPATASR